MGSCKIHHGVERLNPQCVLHLETNCCSLYDRNGCECKRRNQCPLDRHYAARALKKMKIYYVYIYEEKKEMYNLFYNLLCVIDHAVLSKMP